MSQKLRSSENVFCIAEEQGCRAFKKKLGHMVLTVGIRVSKDTCQQRMIERGDSLENIEKRIRHFDEYDEGSIWKKTDIWINGELSIDEMFQELKAKETEWFENIRECCSSLEFANS